MADMDQDDVQDQPQFTGDDLAELHDVARQLQMAGDPRAARVANFIAAQSGGGDGSGGPGFAIQQADLVTSWQDDLENDLWGDQSAQGNESGDSDAEGENNSTASVPSAENGPGSAEPKSAQSNQQAHPQPQQQPRKGSQSAPQKGQQSNQQAQQQKQPQPTATVIVTYDKTAGIKHGSHSGLYLTGTQDGEVLYDPSGSYRQHTRGSGGLLTKDDDQVSLEDYIRYHKGTGSEVKTYTFDLSPADVKQIYARAEKQGEKAGPYCSNYVSSAISGVGPFATVHHTCLPGSLASELEDLQFAGNPNPTHSTGSGKGLGGGGGSAW